MEPYRPFAGTFFKNAADPTSPLSPFSPDSAAARATAIDLWREVIEGSDAKVPKRLRADLPELLWLSFMGHVLFWVHDPTPGAAATRRVVARTAPLIVRAIGLTRLPVVRGLLEEVTALIGELKLVYTRPDTAVR
jgi:hypothetical protein